MPQTEVFFYKDDDGSVPVLDWLLTLCDKNDRAARKCFVSVRWGPLSETGVRRVSGGGRGHLACCQRSGSRSRRASREALGPSAGRRVSSLRRYVSGSTWLRRHEAIRLK